MSTLESLHWRYATKKYDPTKKLSVEQRDMIMEALRLAPSSFGLQGWKFIHVTSPETREKLRAAAYGQSPVTDASDFFVLATPLAFGEADVDRYITLIAKIRGVSVEVLKEDRDMMVGSVRQKGPDGTREWLARQVYIALGFALAAAAENHIDATPMEGFDPKQFDEILGLADLGLTSRVMLAVGFRSSEDRTQTNAKVRFPKSDVFIER